MEADGSFVASSPVPVSDSLLVRGAQRYDIYCAPCHTGRGDGQGILFDQGVVTASFHDDRIRDLPDGQVFDVITNGTGLMSGYRYPISTVDRWAIVAHVRVLQQRQLEREAR